MYEVKGLVRIYKVDRCLNIYKDENTEFCLTQSTEVEGNLDVWLPYQSLLGN